MQIAGALPEVGRLPYAARVRALAAIRRARALLDARETVLLAALADDASPFPDPRGALEREWVREDVACALRIAPATAHAKLVDATELMTRLPDTVAAMAAGVIDARYAARLLDGVRPLPDGNARQVQDRVLPRAGEHTVSQFVARVRRAVLAADPRRAEQRHRDAVTDRRVVLRPQPDGVTELWALLPTEGAARLKARLDAEAAEACVRGDSRTTDQRRADALVALADLTTDYAPGATGGERRGPAVHVVVALSTLLDLDQQPGELNGDPIPASLARRLAFDPTGTWRRLLTDPHGNLVDVSATTYRPPAALDRYVRLRDRTCRFPGCRRRAARCDLDHATPWPAGPTSAGNLHVLCPRHHHLKHEAGWQVRRDPDGATRWRSPSGATYTKAPDERPSDRAAALVAIDPDPPF